MKNAKDAGENSTAQINSLPTKPLSNEAESAVAMVTKTNNAPLMLEDARSMTEGLEVCCFIPSLRHFQSDGAIQGLHPATSDQLAELLKMNEFGEVPLEEFKECMKAGTGPWIEVVCTNSNNKWGLSEMFAGASSPLLGEV